MPSTLDFVSLAAGDLARSESFYRDGLGIPAEQVSRGADHLKIDLENGVSIVLYERAAFERQFGDLVSSTGAGGLILSQSVDKKPDVEALLKRAVAHGGTAAGPAVDQDWGGYAGYLKDPDGHLWEIVWDGEVG